MLTMKYNTRASNYAKLLNIWVSVAGCAPRVGVRSGGVACVEACVGAVRGGRHHLTVLSGRYIVVDGNLKGRSHTICNQITTRTSMPLRSAVLAD
jgi:hypothetical protein